MAGGRSKIQMKFRIPPALHRVLTETAASEGISVTEALNRAISDYVSANHCRAHQAVNCPNSVLKGRGSYAAFARLFNGERAA